MRAVVTGVLCRAARADPLWPARGARPGFLLADSGLVRPAVFQCSSASEVEQPLGACGRMAAGRDSSLRVPSSAGPARRAFSGYAPAPKAQYTYVLPVCRCTALLTSIFMENLLPGGYTPPAKQPDGTFAVTWPVGGAKVRAVRSVFIGGHILPPLLACCTLFALRGEQCWLASA